MQIYFFDTCYGQITLAWSIIDGIPKGSKILLPNSTMKTEDYPEGEVPPKEIKELAKKIASFLGGEDIVFTFDFLNLNILTIFQRKVLLDALGKIGWGEVDSYKDVAKRLGMERGARAVARVLANNPFPIIIPCHRVIRSDGTIGGYRGGTKMKISLLKSEGIQIDDKLRTIKV